VSDNGRGPAPDHGPPPVEDIETTEPGAVDPGAVAPDVIAPDARAGLTTRQLGAFILAAAAIVAIARALRRRSTAGD
jgi:hypothetical protein